MAVKAHAARAGVYDYLGREVDPAGKKFAADQVVKVYRPAKEVFDKASLASFVAKPITDGHPSVPVTASNWRDHARGSIFKAEQNENFVDFDLAFMDAALVAKIDDGTCELSKGYSCDLAFEDGTAPDGTAYQAVQRNIRGNHVAVVPRGRAGSECRVADAASFALCDSNPNALPQNDGDPTVTTKTITFDGLPLLVTDAAEAAINKQAATITALTADKSTLEAKAVEDAAAIVTKDAEIAKLTADLADAKLTPQQMRDAGKAYAAIAGKAKASGITVSDEMDEATIMKAVVEKAMPGNTYTGDHVQIAFDTLTKDVKVADTVVQPLGNPIVVGDAVARETKALDAANDHNAWRNASAAK